MRNLTILNKSQPVLRSEKTGLQEVDLIRKENRTVRVLINSEHECTLYARDIDGVEKFIAHLIGFEDVRFYADGLITLVFRSSLDGDSPTEKTPHNDLQIYSSEMQLHSFENVQAKFTKPTTRRQISPELQAIMEMVRLNEVKRDQAAQKRLAKIEAQMKAQANEKSNEPSPKSDSANAPAAKKSSNEPVKPAVESGAASEAQKDGAATE